jgi:hypothetical protein
MSSNENIQFISFLLYFIWIAANVLFWQNILDKDRFRWWWFMRDRILTVAFFSEIILIIFIPLIIKAIN